MARAGLALCLLLLACSGATPSAECSDEAFRALLMRCTLAAADCRAQGGTDEECGTVCDDKAAEWQERCSK